jgi:hypothetical protein
MKMLKRILASLIIAVSVTAISAPAFAETDKGRVTYKPAESVDMTVSKIQLAIDAIQKGASADEIDDLIKNAADFSKEINANDKVDRSRTKATSKLKAIRAKVKSGALPEAEQELKDVLKDFNDLKGLI